MIITRTPFRVSFCGGGSDASWFYRANGSGAVLSTAIRQYMYIVIHPYFSSSFAHKRIRLKYSQTEDVASVDEIQHEILRESLRRLGLPTGIEIASFADIPSGTGLGSSSTFTVGLLHGLHAYQGRQVAKAELARMACEIEIDILGKPIGKQDQYAAAMGGLNTIEFHADESVSTIPFLLSRESRVILESRLRLYYLGLSRSADSILAAQNSPIDRQTKFQSLRNIVSHIQPMSTALASPEALASGEAGRILHLSWLIKKSLTPEISGSHVDSVYDKALAAGAVGGKLLGAGGSGFLLLDHHDHEALGQALELTSLPFEIDTEGTKVIFYEN